MTQVLNRDVSLITRLADLPSEAAAEKEYLPQRSIASAASIPPRVGGEIAAYAASLAEGEGFEPPEPFRVQWFSRPPPSTTRPSLRGENLPGICAVSEL